LGEVGRGKKISEEPCYKVSGFAVAFGGKKEIESPQAEGGGEKFGEGGMKPKKVPQRKGKLLVVGGL